MVGAVDFYRFREAVDHVLGVRDGELIKLLYLTAARPSEICTRTTPSELRNQATKPYGRSMRFWLSRFKKEKDVLLIRVALAMRRQSLPSYKIIALPTQPSFEPWTRDLAKRIIRNKKLEFDLTRVTVNKIVKENLTPLLGREIRAKDLKQLRLKHLAKLYGFDPYDLAALAGTNLKKNLILGEQSVGNIETLLKLAWRRYFPKLLKPINELKS